MKKLINGYGKKRECQKQRIRKNEEYEKIINNERGKNTEKKETVLLRFYFFGFFPLEA